MCSTPSPLPTIIQVCNSIPASPSPFMMTTVFLSPPPLHTQVCDCPSPTTPLFIVQLYNGLYPTRPLNHPSSLRYVIFPPPSTTYPTHPSLSSCRCVTTASSLSHPTHPYPYRCVTAARLVNCTNLGENAEEVRFILLVMCTHKGRPWRYDGERSVEVK